MDRRLFLRRAGLIAAGVVAADQLELLERLMWKRRFFPSAELSADEHTGLFTLEKIRQASFWRVDMEYIYRRVYTGTLGI